MIPGYQDFEFDLPGALLSRLVEVLDGLAAAPLNVEALESVPEAQGVYQLFLRGQLVYIGKTDAEAGLSRRLARHQRKIQHRHNLDPADVSFKAVRIYVFTAVDLETQLIEHYSRVAPVQWNNSGFGSNDPGRERDTTGYKDDHFDALYPVDIDRILSTSFPRSGTTASILTNLKNALPYVFRFESAGPRARLAHPDLVATSVEIPNDLVLTARNVITAVVPILPRGWQAVQFPGYIVLYKNETFYRYGTVISRS